MQRMGPTCASTLVSERGTIQAPGSIPPLPESESAIRLGIRRQEHGAATQHATSAEAGDDGCVRLLVSGSAVTIAILGYLVFYEHT